MSALRLEYDGDQHGTAYKEPQNKKVSIDCPFTGKGDEFSPGNLVVLAGQSGWYRCRGLYVVVDGRCGTA
jgi:hypothetical protein